VITRATPPDGARRSKYLADNITGAKFLEVPGPDLLPFVADTGRIADAIEHFVTGRLVTHDDHRVLATVLFTDIVGSTALAGQLGDRQWREILASHDALVLTELERFRGREVKTTGDGVLATFDGPGRALRCARAIRDALQPLGLAVRIGVHTGEIEQRGDDVAGIAVHIGQRVCALAGPGEILASSSVPPLVAGSGIEFTDRGEHELKGVPGHWRVYAVEG
jgi:class 3 adenylate cyclase